MKKIMVGIFLFSIFFLSASADMHRITGTYEPSDFGGHNQNFSVSTWGGILFLVFLGVLFYRRKKLTAKQGTNDN